MDITGPYCVKPRKNRYFLTFIDHFTKYVEAFPITDVSAETCARIYATQIIARHGSGYTLITDHGRSFTSAFFQETCKILKVRKVRTSAYHTMSNGMVEGFHRVLHDSIAHYTQPVQTGMWFCHFLRLTEQHHTVRLGTVLSIYYMVERWFYQTRET